MTTFWMSFADANRPAGSQFLGVLILEAESFPEAMTYSHLSGLNPGGEIQFVELPDGWTIHPDYVGRLLSREEAEQVPKPVKKGSE